MEAVREPAAGRDLAQACRDFYGPRIGFLLWGLCEVAIAACDLAEVLGTAVALQLLFGIPLFWGVLITAADEIVMAWSGDTHKNPFNRGGWPDGTPESVRALDRAAVHALGLDPRACARFVEEARIGARIPSEHVVEVVGATGAVGPPPAPRAPRVGWSPSR